MWQDGGLLRGVCFMVVRLADFWLVGGLLLIPPVGKTLLSSAALPPNMLYYILYIIINCTFSMVNQQLISCNDCKGFLIV